MQVKKNPGHGSKSKATKTVDEPNLLNKAILEKPVESNHLRSSPVSVSEVGLDSSALKGEHSMNPLPVDDEEGGDDDVTISSLSEIDVVEGLKELFREKNGREVTEAEVKLWLDAIHVTERVV